MSGGAASRAGSPTSTVKYFALYLQDDWKVTPKLTLNLGVRWEYEGPLTDRFDQLSNFDPFLQTLIGNVPVVGGLAYPGVNGLDRGNRDARYREFGPRLGFAYQLFSKTVVRGGYGIYYLPSTGGFASLPRTGFDLTTPLIASNAGVNGGFAPTNDLSNPFPSGLLQPTKSAGGPTTGAGTGVAGNLRISRLDGKSRTQIREGRLDVGSLHMVKTD
jgi:TonB dependent receptor